MSIRVTSAVWEQSQAEGTTLLILLALADNADNKSAIAWPSVGDLARRSRVDERTVQRHLRKLEELGEVEVVRKGGRIDGEYRATVYRVVVQGRQAATADDEGRGGNLSPLDVGRGDKPGHSGVTELCHRNRQENRQEKNDDLAALVVDAFSYWHTTFGLNGQTKLTPARRKKLQSRLKSRDLGATPAQVLPRIKRAIDGCAGSDFHVKNGHIDLTLICRSDEKLEEFERKPAPRKVQAKDLESKLVGS